MMHSWIEHCICNPEHSGWTRIIIEVNGAMLKCKSCTYPTPGRNFFLYECINIRKSIGYNLKRAPAKGGIIMLMKVKVMAKSNVFRRPRSFQNLSEVNRKVWISRTGCLIMKIRPGNAILELLKFGKMSTKPKCPNFSAKSLYKLVISVPHPENVLSCFLMDL